MVSGRAALICLGRNGQDTEDLFVYFAKPGSITAFLSLFILSCIPATAQRLSVSPNFVYFTQSGSTAPAPVTVKVTSLASSNNPYALGAFTTSARTLSGGSWLSVSPASGAGSSPLTITATTTGMAPGEYLGTVTITAVGFANSPYDLGVSLTILAPALTVHPGSLNFAAISGGAAPTPESLLVSMLGGGSFSWTATASVTSPSGGTWLKIGSTSGTGGTTIPVSVDPTALAAGTYEGQVVVTSQVNGATSTVKVPVTLTVTAPRPPELQLNPSSINLVYDPSGATPLYVEAIQVTNAGSGTINWTAKVAVDSPSGGTWLSVSPASGSTPGTLVPSASPTGLSPGMYSGTITVTGSSGTSSSTISAQARVFFTVRAPAIPVVSVTPSAVGFDYADSVLTPPSGTVTVTSSSSGLSFTASASTAKGGNWLTVTPASGAVTTSSSVTVSVSGSVAAALSAGIYTGNITIKVPGAAKNTFTVLASLQVFPSGQTPFFVLEPGAVLFTAAPSTTAPVSPSPILPSSNPQSVNLEVVGSTTLGWSTNIATTSGGSWLTVSPASGTGSAAVKVSVNDAKLSDGVYSGSVTFNAAAGSSTKPVTLRVQLVVGGPFEVGPSFFGPSQSIATVPRALITLPADGFSSTAGLPINVSVMVVDGNGNAMDTAVVNVASSNGEPPLTLTSVGGGAYSGLFQPQASGPLVLTATAVNGGQLTSAPDAVSGDVASSSEAAPVVYQGGVVNAASFESSPAPVAPGSLVSLFGVNLTSQGTSAAAMPLPFLLGGVSVTVGGFPAALVTTGSGQINLQIPFELQGEQAGVVVNSGNWLSAPTTVQLSPAAPALFTLSQNGAGPATALRADYSAISSANPATAGDAILLYSTALGLLSSALADGAASPVGITTAGAVTVTIGGVNATVAYAGVAPGYPGLYQINVTVPGGVAPGDAAVVVSAGGMSGTSLATVSVR
jgi:uncharacterized protein (TIGR03437 family)